MGGDEITPSHHPVVQIDKKVKGYGEVVHFGQLKTNHFKWLIWLSCSLLSLPPLSLSSRVLLCCINTISVSGGSKHLVKSTTQNMATRLQFCMIKQALPYVQYISLLAFVQNCLLWQHTYMQASSSSGKMPLDQHWDTFTALSWIKKPVWWTTNRFWITQGSLSMMGKYHTYSSPQCENMRHSILPHYVTQKRNVHSCELSYTTDAPFQKVFQVMLWDAEII